MKVKCIYFHSARGLKTPDIHQKLDAIARGMSTIQGLVTFMNNTKQAFEWVVCKYIVSTPIMAQCWFALSDVKGAVTVGWKIMPLVPTRKRNDLWFQINPLSAWLGGRGQSLKVTVTDPWSKNTTGCSPPASSGLADAASVEVCIALTAAVGVPSSVIFFIVVP